MHHEEVESFASRRKECRSLKELSTINLKNAWKIALSKVPKILAKKCHQHLTKLNVTHFELEIKIINRDFNEYFFRDLPLNLIRDLVPELLEILSAESDRVSVSGCDESTELNDSLYVCLRLAEVLCIPDLFKFDLSPYPKRLRSSLYPHLYLLRNIRELDLGDGYHGWCSEDITNGIYYNGLNQLRNLVRFRLRYDCTNLILRCISTNCGQSLRSLDIGDSEFVNEVSSIKSCYKLMELNSSGTSLTCSALGDVLESATELRVLTINSLVELLHYFINQTGDEIIPTRHDKLGSIISVESFYVKPYLLNALSHFAPNLKSMTLHFLPLPPLLSYADVITSRFNYVSDLVIWGGNYYMDGLIHFLKSIHSNIRSLELIHVEDLNFNSLKDILSFPNLSTLRLYNCYFVEDEFFLSQKFPVNTKLLNLALHSTVEDYYLKILIGKCVNLEKINIGISTNLNDTLLKDIIGEGIGLKQLKDISLAHSRYLTIDGVRELLKYCGKLKYFSDIENCSEISKEEIKSLRYFIKNNNYDLFI